MTIIVNGERALRRGDQNVCDLYVISVEVDLLGDPMILLDINLY